MSNIQQEDQDFNAERILLSLILILPKTIPELTRLGHDHFYYTNLHYGTFLKPIY